MKLVVGLGNPGNNYKNTRHNVGFQVIDNYSKIHDLPFKSKFNGLYAEMQLENDKVVFLKPQKFMNLSGEIVKSFVSYFKVNIEDILIIHDDLDIELGKIKLKNQGTSGGHNGLKNIEENLGTIDYKRLKIGISSSKTLDTKDYVLGKFSDEEKKIIDQIITESPNIIEDYFKLSFENLMNKYN